jgi:hypothetical protein
MAGTAGGDGVIPVYLEVGKKRVFACSLDWPGWARSGKTEELAIEALETYVPRYGAVAEQAGMAFPAEGVTVSVVERIPGSATTDFGAPASFATSDAEPLPGGQAERVAELVRAAWMVFDRIAAATPAELRKGPRGGGRDRDKMIDHVLGAEAAYARKIGIKHRQPALDDREAISALREAITNVLGAPSDGKPPIDKGWPPRYAARRIAWHVLDHAWEMQDRSNPEG